MTEFEREIGHEFKDPSLLAEALTHSSYANERHTGACNERLEFLGDSVLSVVVSDWLFRRSPRVPEGELTKRRAALVCEGALHGFAEEIDLGSHMLLGNGEERTGGRERPSILADAFEALIAAIYLDGGIVAASEFIHRFIDEDRRREKPRDYKTELQEIVQQNPEERLGYVVADESGPDHDKTFTVEVRLNSNVIGRGVGHSKKQAEQKAAAEALELMGL